MGAIGDVKEELEEGRRRRGGGGGGGMREVKLMKSLGA